MSRSYAVPPYVFCETDLHFILDTVKFEIYIAKLVVKDTTEINPGKI
jgi:hypothetical protein